MNKKVDKLLKDAENESKEIYDKLVLIANKVARRKAYLVIDIMEMESMVDKDKVEPVSAIERVEVKA